MNHSRCLSPDGLIYAIKFPNGIKIGITSNPKTRLESYKSPWMQPIQSIYCLPTSNPKCIESFLKKKYSYNAVKNSSEFITNISWSEIVETIQELVKKYKCHRYSKFLIANKQFILDIIKQYQIDQKVFNEWFT